MYASDCYQVTYDIEMQNDDRKNLSKRCRYYQAEVDIASLKPGQDYQDLQPSFVIFICSYDPFGDGLYRHTIENICHETGKVFGDGAVKIILSTKGKNTQDVPIELVHFLQYVETSTQECAEETNNAIVLKLHEKIKLLKESRDLESGYMRFEELLRECEEKEAARIMTLINAMAEEGLQEEIPKLAKDKEFFQQMLEKYNL